MRTQGRASMAGGLTVALVAGSLMAVGASLPAAASDGGCGPAGDLPTLNTWYDQNNNYQGTRLAHREQTYNLATDVYETYGHNFRQIEVWDRGGLLPPRRVECERKPAEPQPEPEQPQVIGGGGGFETGIQFPSFGITIWVTSTPNTGNVNVGEIEQVE